MRFFALSFLLFVLIPCALADPEITSVLLGDFEQGAVLSIEGNGFGIKEHIEPLVWDTFEQTNLNDPIVGSTPLIGPPWSQYGTSPVISNSRSHAGEQSVFLDMKAGVVRFEHDLEEFEDAVYLSWWRYHESDPEEVLNGEFCSEPYHYGVPGYDPDDCHNYKMLYLMGTTGVHGLDPQLMIGAIMVSRQNWQHAIQGGVFEEMNNHWDVSYSYADTLNQWQRWDTYAQYETGDFSSNNGVLNAWLNGQKVLNLNSYDYGQVPSQWRDIGIGALFRPRDVYTSFQSFFDNIYIDDTLARIELCNDSTWSNIELVGAHCEIQIPHSVWNDTDINFTVNLGSFTQEDIDDGLYLFVVNGDGVVSDGFPVDVMASSEPIITSVSDSLSDAASATLNGSNFGDLGPDVLIFDTFQRGSDGSLISVDSDVGDWTSVNQNWDPKYVADDEPGENNVAGKLVEEGVHRQLKVVFPNPVQEFFLSYRVKIPDGKNFPGSFSEETFPGSSTWKLTWLMDQEGGYYGEDDYCLPTWVGAFFLAGNDAIIQPSIDTRTNAAQYDQMMWFSFDVWNRFTVWMKAGDDPDNDNGYIWQQGMSEPLGQVVRITDNHPLFDNGPLGAEFPDGSTDNGISQWDRFNIPGWTRGSENTADGLDEPNTEAWYDDIYVATGPGAQARVELGNAPVYEDCTKLAISVPTSWSDKSITFEYYEGTFDADDERYLFVVTADGNVSDGFGPLDVSFQTFSPGDLNRDGFVDLDDLLMVNTLSKLMLVGRHLFE